MRTIIVIIGLICMTAVGAGATDQSVALMLKQRQWQALAGFFDAQSVETIRDYFHTMESGDFELSPPGKILYRVRFADAAEIGAILYREVPGGGREAQVVPQVRPLHIISRWREYALRDVVVPLGAAEIRFIDGVLYVPDPAPDPLIFVGRWNFRITPGNEEERLTLSTLFSAETFSRESRSGLFILRDKDFLKGFTPRDTRPTLVHPEAAALLTIYRQEFGLTLTFSPEKLYLPFPSSFNQIVFPREKRGFYRFTYDPSLPDDTMLESVPDQRLLLSYAHEQQMKFSFRSRDELRSVHLNLFINPNSRLISGTARLKYQEPSALKRINLARGLRIRGLNDSQNQQVRLFRQNDTYYVVGDELREMNVFYSGNIPGSEQYTETISQTRRLDGRAQDTNLFFLSRDQDYYPQGDIQFFESSVSVNLPNGFNCLASGNLEEVRKVEKRTIYRFNGGNSKGISLVCGQFRQVGEVAATLPVRLFAMGDVSYRYFFDDKVVADRINFLCDVYGKPPLRELNVLLRHWDFFGGVSNNGFVIFNLAAQNDMEMDWRRTTADNPMVLNDLLKDNLLHEFAHQWWGGQVSWKSYRDVWITEGLAHFSTLLYLQKRISTGRYRSIVENIRRWAMRKSSYGPIAYGKRLLNLYGDYDIYQSVVYNKSALVFQMLAEIIGEEALLERLRGLLEHFRYQSVGTAQFITYMTQKEPRLQKFFAGWIHSRRLPEVVVNTAISGSTVEIGVKQLHTDFVFPLQVEVVTAEGSQEETVVVDQADMRLTLSRPTPIREVRVFARTAPVEVKEKK